MNSSFWSNPFVWIGRIEKQQRKEKQEEEQRRAYDVYTIPIPNRTSMEKPIEISTNKNAKYIIRIESYFVFDMFLFFQLVIQIKVLLSRY